MAAIPTSPAPATTPLHLVVGPVGAGKSTFGLQLSRELRAVRLTLDEWMATLFGADERPAEGRIEWYLERRDRCLDQMWRLTERLADVGTVVVLEIGLIVRAEREAFYRKVDDAGHALSVYLVDAPRDVRRERVAARNLEKGATFSMEVPMPFFEMASDRWQPPEEEEIERRAIRVVSRGS